MAVWLAGAVYLLFFHYRLFLRMRPRDVPLVEEAIARRGLTFVDCHAPSWFERWKQPPSSGWARLIIAEAVTAEGKRVEVLLTVDPAYDKNAADIRWITELA